METMKIFIGSCIDITDSNSSYLCDATELAQAVEGGTRISKERFLRFCVPHTIKHIKKGMEFWYNKDLDLYWSYDKDEDVHYFYVG